MTSPSLDSLVFQADKHVDTLVVITVEVIFLIKIYSRLFETGKLFKGTSGGKINVSVGKLDPCMNFFAPALLATISRDKT